MTRLYCHICPTLKTPSAQLVTSRKLRKNVARSLNVNFPPEPRSAASKTCRFRSAEKQLSNVVFSMVAVLD
jgi:hypothetical protein